MTDLTYLKKHGVSSDAYKKIFSQPRDKMTPRQRKLVEMLSQRSRDGYLDGLQDYPAYHSVDLAHETAWSQTTPTLVRHILSRGLNETQTLAALKEYGLSESELFTEIPHPLDPGQRALKFNPPVFFQLYIPIVKAYVEAILSQIYNERNTSPLFTYKPLKATAKNQVLCEIVTDISDTMATQLGYAATLRQAIQQMLKYGVVLAFPREEWFWEKQIVEWDEAPETITVKEGIRYVLPHPTRMAYDRTHPATSFNSDSGCSWALNWGILKYGDVVDNRNYWNKNAIFGGVNWGDAPGAKNYFNEVFPCQQKWPDGSVWKRSETREDRAACYNTTTDRDKAVFVCNHFVKIIPDDWDLTDTKDKTKGYKYPVWHRFTLAGDDTVVWAGPCAYNPIWFMGYDYDEMSAHNLSFALELIPWQDHLGMILSQMLLTAKQNLLDITFYDQSVVDKQDIEKMANSGERKYREKIFIGFDPLKMQAQRSDMSKVFSSVNFSKQSTQELLQMVSTVLNVMERVLGISAQTSGGAGPHQQSKQEVIQTGVSSTNRVAKISSSVDEGTDAWMRQIYDGHQAHGDNKFVAEVSSDVEDLDKHLEKLGLEKGETGDGVLMVSGHKKKLRLEGFASVNKGPQHDKEKEVSQAIFQVVGTLAGQPELFKKIGAKNLLAMIEQAALLAGAPRDFRLRVDPKAEKDGEVAPNIIEAIQQAQQATMQAIEEKVAKPIAGEVAQDKSSIEQIQAALQKLEGIYKVAQAAQQKVELEKQRAAAQIQIEDTKAQADQKRLDQSASRQEARADHALIAKLQRESAELNQKLAAMKLELDAKIDTERTKAAASAKVKAAGKK